MNKRIAVFIVIFLVMLYVLLPKEQIVVQPETAQYTYYLPAVISGCGKQVSGRGASTAFRDSITQDMITELELSWVYNHNLYADWGNHFNCVEDVPVFWCASEGHWRGWRNKVPASYRGPIIFLNEWGADGQCNASVKAVVEMYRRLGNRHGYENIVFGNFADLDYLQNWSRFRTLYEEITEGAGLPFNPLAFGLHDYLCWLNLSPRSQVDDFYRLLDELHIRHRPVWVTEYGCSDPAWVETYSRFYESDPRVERWAYFSICMPPDYFNGAGLYGARAGYTANQRPNNADGSLVCGGLNDRGRAFIGK